MTTTLKPRVLQHKVQMINREGQIINLGPKWWTVLPADPWSPSVIFRTHKRALDYALSEEAQKVHASYR